MMKCNMKRKMAAALCAIMLYGSVTPAVFAEGWEGPGPQGGPGPGEGEVVTTETTPPATEETTTPATEETTTPATEETTTPATEETTTPATEETTPPATEETTPPPATEETTPPATEETTPPPATEETTPPPQEPGFFENEGAGEGEGFGTFNLKKNATQTEPKISITYSVTDESAAGQANGVVTGTVTNTTGALPVALAIYKDGTECGAAAIYSEGESFTFGGLTAGEYLINYVYSGSSVVNIQDKVEVKTAESSVPTTPTDPKISISYNVTDESAAGQANGVVTGTVTNTTGALPVALAIYKDGTECGAAAIYNEGESFTFGGLTAGEYVINYVYSGSSVVNIQDKVEVKTAESSVPTTPTDPKISISYNVTDESAAGQANGVITGTVTNTTGALPVALAIYKDGTECGAAAIYSEGESFTFGGLTAGEYVINYVYSGSSVVNIQDKVEVKTAPATAPTEPKIDKITRQDRNATAADAQNGVVSAAVEFSNASELLVAIYAKGDNMPLIDSTTISSGSTYTFSGLAPGEYKVNYALDGAYYNSEYVTVGVDAAPAPKPVISVSYAYTKASSASAQDGVVKGTVTVTNGTYPLHVELFEKTGTSAIRGTTLTADGMSFTFDKLPAGEYLINYAFDGSQAVDKQDEVEVEYAARAAISIASVIPGEKTLTVKGTAQPGFTIQAETVPATQKAAMIVGDKGTFEWVLAAEPNTYTKVIVFYANDSSSAAAKEGSWTVTAPMTTPTIEVDPINNHSTTVVVKTGANLAVTLKTSDSTQTLVSDANGLAHFSLTHKYLKGEEFTITVVYGAGSGKTVSQKVTVGGAADYNDLEYGDYGEAVLRLTTRLNQLGYPIAPTKDYNSAVREAVRLFQIANGQEADGEAGDRMQAALYSVSAIRYGSGRYPTLVRGDKGIALIKTMQQRLKDLGYYTIKVDGIFGSGTQRAVRLFQSVNGLPETGIADNATQVLLYSSAAKPIGYGTSGSYTTLQRSGKYKSAVVPLQRRLKELGYYSGSVDGYFGSKTYRAVRNFQSRNGLKVNGIADPLTQQVLFSSAAKKYKGSSSSSSSSVGYRLLYWGCRGDEVKRLQNALINAGYKKYVRSADGIYGQWTYDAVCAFQRDRGLSVDGIAGKKTQNALYGTNY